MLQILVSISSLTLFFSLPMLITQEGNLLCFPTEFTWKSKNTCISAHIPRMQRHTYEVRQREREGPYARSIASSHSTTNLFKVWSKLP